MSTAEATQTATGTNPSDPFPVPDDRLFGSEEGEEQIAYREAPDLEAIGQTLIRTLPEFADLRTIRVDYYWKRKGGASGVKRRFGACVKAGDVVRLYADVRFIVWLAADHARDVRLTALQVEALIYHQLCHTERHERGWWRLRSHDFEGFDGEIERYGTWQSDLHRMATVIGHVAEHGTAPVMQMDRLPGLEKEDGLDVGDPAVDEAIHRLAIERGLRVVRDEATEEDEDDDGDGSEEAEEEDDTEEAEDAPS